MWICDVATLGIPVRFLFKQDHDQEINSDLTDERDIVTNEMIVPLRGAVEEIDMTVNRTEFKCRSKSYNIEKLTFMVFIHVD